MLGCPALLWKEKKKSQSDLNEGFSVSLVGITMNLLPCFSLHENISYATALFSIQLCYSHLYRIYQEVHILIINVQSMI